MKKEKFLYEARAKIIKAIAHPTRLFIVEELEKGDKCVNELTEMIESDMSTVSKHLSVLKNVGIVSDIRVGNSIIYHLKATCILNFIGCIENVIKENASEQIAISRCCKK